MLVYLGVFLAAFLLAQTDQRRQRFGEGIAICDHGRRPALARQSPSARRLRPLGGSLGGSRTPLPARLLERSRDFLCDGDAALAVDDRAARCSPACAGPRPARSRPSCWPSTSPTRAAGSSSWSSPAPCSWPSAAIASGCWRPCSAASLGAVPAVLYVGSHNPIANNVQAPTLNDEGLVTLALLARRDRSSRWPSTGLCVGPSSGRRRPVVRALDLSRDRRVLRGIGDRHPARPGRGRDRLRRPRLGPLLERRPRRPGPARRTPRRSLQRRPRPVLGSRARSVRRKAAARPRRRHLPVLLGSAPAAEHDRPQRPLALPAGAGRAGDRRRHPHPGDGAGAALGRDLGLARRQRPTTRALRGAAQRHPRLRARRRLRLVLADRGDRRRSSSWPPGPWSPPAAASSGEPGRRRAPAPTSERREPGIAPFRPRRRRPRRRLADDAGADRAAAGRPRDPRVERGRRPAGTAKAPSAMPRRPARSSPGRPPPTCNSVCWPR